MTLVENTQETEAKPVTDAKAMSQKEAVYTSIKEAIVNQSVEVTPGVPLKQVVTKQVRKEARTKLFEGFRSGTIKLSKEMDDSKLKKYCSGLINNWLNKDSRFQTEGLK